MTNLKQKAELTNEVAAQDYTKQLAAIMPIQNGTPAGLSALQASLLRGKELVK